MASPKDYYHLTVEIDDYRFTPDGLRVFTTDIDHTKPLSAQGVLLSELDASGLAANEIADIKKIATSKDMNYQRAYHRQFMDDKYLANPLATTEVAKAAYEKRYLAYYSGGLYGLPDGKGGFTYYEESDYEADPKNARPYTGNVDPIITRDMRFAQYQTEAALHYNMELKHQLTNWGSQRALTVGFGYSHTGIDEGQIVIYGDQPGGPQHPFLASPARTVVTAPRLNYTKILTKEGKLPDAVFSNALHSYFARSAMQATDGLKYNDTAARMADGAPLSQLYVTNQVLRLDREYRQTPLYRAFEAKLLGKDTSDITTDQATLARADEMVSTMRRIYEKVLETNPEIKGELSFKDFANRRIAASHELVQDCSTGKCAVEKRPDSSYVLSEAKSKEYDGMFERFRKQQGDAATDKLMVSNLLAVKANTEWNMLHYASRDPEIRYRSDTAGSEFISLFNPYMSATLFGERSVSQHVSASVDLTKLPKRVQGTSWLEHKLSIHVVEGRLPVMERGADGALPLDSITIGPLSPFNAASTRVTSPADMAAIMQTVERFPRAILAYGDDKYWSIGGETRQYQYLEKRSTIAITDEPQGRVDGLYKLPSARSTRDKQYKYGGTYISPYGYFGYMRDIEKYADMSEKTPQHFVQATHNVRASLKTVGIETPDDWKLSELTSMNNIPPLMWARIRTDISAGTYRKGIELPDSSEESHHFFREELMKDQKLIDQFSHFMKPDQEKIETFFYDYETFERIGVDRIGPYDPDKYTGVKDYIRAAVVAGMEQATMELKFKGKAATLDDKVPEAQSVVRDVRNVAPYLLANDPLARRMLEDHGTQFMFYTGDKEYGLGGSGIRKDPAEDEKAAGISSMYSNRILMNQHLAGNVRGFINTWQEEVAHHVDNLMAKELGLNDQKISHFSNTIVTDAMSDPSIATNMKRNEQDLSLQIREQLAKAGLQVDVETIKKQIIRPSIEAINLPHAVYDRVRGQRDKDNDNSRDTEVMAKYDVIHRGIVMSLLESKGLNPFATGAEAEAAARTATQTMQVLFPDQGEGKPGLATAHAEQWRPVVDIFTQVKDPALRLALMKAHVKTDKEAAGVINSAEIKAIREAKEALGDKAPDIRLDDKDGAQDNLIVQNATIPVEIKKQQETTIPK